MAIPYVFEDEIEHGVCKRLTPLIRRVICNNPGPFTYTGTTTFIVGNGVVAIIDPGPKNDTHLDAIISACSNMSISKTGAIIVIERSNSLSFLENTGDEMNIKVNQPIIESIFFKNSPLHDGAIIISNNYIKATRVVLPINNDKIIPNKYGLRHRAAVSISEKTDALVVVVSEESGQMSYIKNGEFKSFKDSEDLVNLIKKDLD